MAVVHESDGLKVLPGDIVALAGYRLIQKSVVPVVTRSYAGFHGIGTAVCVAPGCFVTARHVCADSDHGLPPELEILDRPMWVAVESEDASAQDELLRSVRLLPVTWANAHSGTDLATLTVDVPLDCTNKISPLTLGLRMPELGEVVVSYGYDDVEFELASGAEPDDGVVALLMARQLSVNVGAVRRHHPERRVALGLHETSPGFRTDAPTPHGLSGGPVIDQGGEVIGFNSEAYEPTEENPRWDSFVSGSAAALELHFKLPAGTFDAEVINLEQLMLEGGISFRRYLSFDIDPDTRFARYVTVPGGEDRLVARSKE